ncbi:hypothetical protein A2291_07380 [candidate division WOR-1 bacterium RIFOXYB2_FULL_42_35]|uniref:Uncharacterized protein n=1 Tax=candidate division WOR-1 bacterium RIFOXYC2_FULL_41_25 TaxID=1802586 RepID=A0A1F4TK92_UNCSA|nr:MAG: hypothetical protein A2247_04240 [candidate division WOR-1 bacterium RIFOXYA2_FULL_41_14]OGC22727.1 MAG: hypothetical protein A2291_07380 [candidate division WOR-1 bacterium RIFOXYB2_FULL_42_35]OGC33148.1 MAG: hypothetical protein A2462_06275 [candidate division WOR-1 bacterium RIFOXYC2_FULL_41_25]OGC44218.1 MAG: hypothetical protein A2548_07005 [candidate division WOR-1 bacterium RIFOXYD2_FULL_41_8]
MSPVKKFKLDNYKEVLKEIEELGRTDCLRELEDRVIKEIIQLICEGTEEAKIKLIKLEALIKEDIGFTPRNKLLVSALRNSIIGALSAAKLCL